MIKQNELELPNSAFKILLSKRKEILLTTLEKNPVFYCITKDSTVCTSGTNKSGDQAKCNISNT